MPAPSAHTAVVLSLHPLSYHNDGEDVVVGRTDIDSYGVFPPDGAALLRRLADGLPLDEAARWYAETYGEQVDLEEFVGVLSELEFLAPGAAPAGSAGESPAVPPPVRWQRLGRAVFSVPAWCLYVAILASAAVAMAVHPALVPRTSHLFYSRYVTALALTIFLGQIPLIAIHECFHALAGRRLGLRSTLRINRRLYFLVFETTLDGLVVVPRRRRYLPLLAGMLADLVIIGALTLVAAATIRPDGSVAILGGACLALAFATLIRFSWQFYLYMRTDLYAVVVTVLGCQDLHAAGRRILANRFRRLVGRPARDESGLHPRDRRIGRWYSWLMLVGYTFSIGILTVVIIPATWRSLSMATARLAGGGGHSWLDITDSFIFLALMSGQLLVVGFLALRSRLRRRAAAPTYLAS
jgi:hypothetical protein